MLHPTETIKCGLSGFIGNKFDSMVIKCVYKNEIDIYNFLLRDDPLKTKHHSQCSRVTEYI